MSDRDSSYPTPNRLKRSLQNSSISGHALHSNLPKRVKENSSTPSSMSDSDSDSDMDFDTPLDDVLQIYQTMLSNNPAAVTFLFSPAFTTPLKSLTTTLGREYHLSGEVVLEEFRRLLAIKLFTVDEHATKISPTPLMDSVWHAAILDTRFYASLQSGLGLTIHHRPLPADLTSSSSEEQEEEITARERRLAVMTGIYKAYFTSPPLQRRVRLSPPIGKPIHLPEGTGMQIFVKGIKGETLTLNVRSTSLIEDIKATIEEKSGDPQDSQRLIWSGRQLEDGRTLAFYKIGREETFHLVLILAGC